MQFQLQRLVNRKCCASKKGMSAHQIHRMTGISYKTVWFMMPRLRFSMSQHGMIEKLRGVVEIDEVYIGPKEKGFGNPNEALVDSPFQLYQAAAKHTGVVTGLES
jgi:hypothetical protein